MKSTLGIIIGNRDFFPDVLVTEARQEILGDDPNKCVFFHCGNWAKSFLPDIQVKTAEILGTITGEDNTYGAVAGRTPVGPVTFARISTDDVFGQIITYVGEGEFTDDPLDTFGARAVVQVANLQKRKTCPLLGWTLEQPAARPLFSINQEI